MNKFSTAAVFLALASMGDAGIACAGEAGPRSFAPAPAGQSDAEHALEAKNNAYCAAMYGPGYMAVSGSSTCVRIGGSVGVTVGVGSGWKQNRLVAPTGGAGAAAPSFGAVVPIMRAPSSYASAPVGHIVHRSGSGFGSEADATVYLDAKTQTELGVLTTHLSVRGVRRTGSLAGPDYAR